MWIVLGKIEGKRSLPFETLRSLSAHVWSRKSSQNFSKINGFESDLFVHCLQVTEQNKSIRL